MTDTCKAIPHATLIKLARLSGALIQTPKTGINEYNADHAGAGFSAEEIIQFSMFIQFIELERTAMAVERMAPRIQGSPNSGSHSEWTSTTTATSQYAAMAASIRARQPKLPSEIKRQILGFMTQADSIN